MPSFQPDRIFFFGPNSPTVTPDMEITEFTEKGFRLTLDNGESVFIEYGPESGYVETPSGQRVYFSAATPESA
jgi:hypothetical protein